MPVVYTEKEVEDLSRSLGISKEEARRQIIRMRYEDLKRAKRVYDEKKKAEAEGRKVYLSEEMKRDLEDYEKYYVSPERAKLAPKGSPKSEPKSEGSGYSLDGALRRAAGSSSSTQAKPTRAEILELQKSKEEQANKEFRRLISQGKSPQEAAQEVANKYGAQVTIYEMKFESEQKQQEPPKPDKNIAEMLHKGEMPYGAEDQIRELKKKGIELTPFEEQAIKLEEWSFQQRVRGEKAVDKTKPFSVERGKAAVEQLGLGVAAGAAGMGLGLAIAGQKVVTNPITGVPEVVKGTVDWFVGLTPRMREAMQGSPFVAGQIVGEFAFAEIAGRATAKGAGLAKAGALKVAEPAGVVFRRIAEKSRVAYKIGKLKLQDVGWKVTEPLYQKGILRPRIEVVEEKPLSQVLLEAAKTYKNIELGVSNLKGEIRPLSRADIGLIEAKIAEERLKLTPERLAELKRLAEELGWAEEVRLERQEWVKNTRIIDLSETGEQAKIETYYRGKRSFKVESWKDAEKLPEELWSRFEKEGLEFKEIGKINLKRSEIGKLESGTDLSKELKRRWKQRESELDRLEKEGKTKMTGGKQRQIQILKEENKVEAEKVKVRQKEKLREELKDLKKLREEIKLANKFDVVGKVHVFLDTKSVFLSFEHVSQKVFFKQLNKLEMGIGQVFKIDTVELEKLGEKLETKTGTGHIASIDSAQKFGLKEAQKLRQLTRQKPKELIEIPKMEMRPKFNIGREEKKSRRSKKSGRHRIKVKNPVLRFEDILAVEGKKYARKVRKKIGKGGGKRKRSKK